MAVKKKAIKGNPAKYSVDEMINRGGKTTRESEIVYEQVDDETRFTLRIPHALMTKIDSDRRSRVGNVSRNQWIIELIDSQF